MKKEMVQKALALTERCLNEYYQGDPQCIITHLHPHCMLIGAREEEFCFGRDDITALFRALEKDLPNIVLSSQEYFCVVNSGSTCVISGRFIATIEDESSQEFLSDLQRITLVWQQEKNELWMIHFHMSDPLGTLEANELFPHKLSRKMYGYFQTKMAEETGGENRITMRDIDGVTWYVNIWEIVALEAFNLNTIVRTVQRAFEVRCLLGVLTDQLNERLPGRFIRIHRSYTVNQSYIVKIDGLRLQVGEYTYPIARNRRKAVITSIS